MSIQQIRLRVRIPLEFMVTQDTTIESIYCIIQDSLKNNLHQNYQQWTCFCEEQQRYYHLQEKINSLLHTQTLLVDTQSIKMINEHSQPPQEQIAPYSQFLFQNCQQHPSCPLTLICNYQHNCQRRLCVECLYDQKHVRIHHENILPLDHFKEEIRKLAQELLDQENERDNLQKEIKAFEKKMQYVIFQLKTNFESALLSCNESCQMAVDLLKSLESSQILDYPNQVIEEIIKIKQQGLIKQQKSINDLNYKTIQASIKRLGVIVDKFKNQLENFNFVHIPLHECKIQNDQENFMSVVYQGQNLSQAKDQDSFYGKYLISLQYFKIEIHYNFNLIQTLSFPSQTNTTLRDISRFVREKIKNIENFKEIRNQISNWSIWIFHSQFKNAEISDFDLILHKFIRADSIKINLNPQSINNGKLIKLKITVQDGNETVHLKQFFHQQCTIQDLEEIILEQLGIAKDDIDVDVDIYIFNQPYRNESKRQKTLLQLSINDKIQLQAIVRRIKRVKERKLFIVSQSRINQSKVSVLLNVQILDGLTKRQFSNKFQIDETLESLVKTIAYYLNLTEGAASVEIDIEKQSYNSEVQRQMTLYDLKLQDNQIIQVRIRWMGG